MNSALKDQEVKLRSLFEKQDRSRGRRRSKKITRVQELILDTLYVKKRLMRSSEIRIAVGRRIKGVSNYLFFTALNDLFKKDLIIKKKNLLNMKYTFYTLSETENDNRNNYVYTPIHISGREYMYISALRTNLESDLQLFGRFLY